MGTSISGEPTRDEQLFHEFLSLHSEQEDDPRLYFTEPFHWPKWASDAFYKPHKDRNERFKLFVFFVKNDMSPEIALAWVTWHGGYDKAAMADLSNLVSSWKKRKGRTYAYMWKTPVYVMGMDRIHPVKNLDSYDGADKENPMGFYLYDNWPQLGTNL